MKTYKLHELIEIARSGKRFKATRLNVDGPNYFRNERDFKSGSYIWTADHIIADWTVEFEPEVVKFESNNKSGWICIYNQNLAGKRWHIVATEKVEDK